MLAETICHQTQGIYIGVCQNSSQNRHTIHHRNIFQGAIKSLGNQFLAQLDNLFTRLFQFRHQTAGFFRDFLN